MNWFRFIANAFLTRSEPISIVHFLTDRCNARCPHCFLDFNNPLPAQDVLTLEEIRRVTRTLGRCLYNVNLTGGEPFLRDDLFEIVSAYFENTTARSIVITTNGTLVKALAAFLAKFTASSIRGRIKISISVDQLEGKHDAHRNVPGAFRAALESYRLVESCGDSRVMADIALTVTADNYREVASVYAALKGMGIRDVSPILVREAGVLKSICDKAGVQQAYDLLSREVAADQQMRRRMPSQHRFPEALRRAKNELVREAISGAAEARSFRFACSAGSLFGVIHPNGDVMPCEVLGRSRCLGNVREQGFDFMRVWKENNARAFKKELRRNGCHCTYECAWSVNVLADPLSLLRMLGRSGKYAQWNR